MKYRKISELEKLHDNPRTITRGDLDTLKESVEANKDYFEARPLILSNRTGSLVIIAGNQRLEAARELGWEKVPTHLLEGLTEEREKEITIRDNVNNGKWDWDELHNRWDETDLDRWGVEPPEGWNDEEFQVEEDEAPAADETKTYSKAGAIYKLGEHRLIAGSATEADDIKRLVGTDRISMIYTDPPYGVEYKSKKLGGILNDDLQNNDLYQFTRDAFEIVLPHTETDAGVYCWYEDKYRGTIQAAVEDGGYQYKQNLIWNKGMNLSGADYQKAHENCLYFQVNNGKAAWYGGRDKKTILGLRRRDIQELKKSDLIAMIVNMQKEQTVWDFDRDSVTEYQHPTQKPVTLAATAMQNSSKVGDYVIDMFAGSGSTMIAAEQVARRSLSVELDLKYVDVIRKRYAKFVDPMGWEDTWQELTPPAPKSDSEK